MCVFSEVVIKPSSKAKALSVRQVRASDIGSLVSLQGMVTRVSDVKPKITVATYTCDLCSYETYQEVMLASFFADGRKEDKPSPLKITTTT